RPHSGGSKGGHSRRGIGRASLRMPDTAMGVGPNGAFVLGAGRAGRDDILALRKQPRAADATARGRRGRPRLAGPGRRRRPGPVPVARRRGPRARLAAAALLRVAPTDSRPVKVLAHGMASADAVTRRYAARAAGLAGAAAPLAGKLAALLKDPDVAVRRSALQALATLGPPAALAVGTVTGLLDQPESAVGAADPPGRIGPAARPSLKRLAQMLSAGDTAQRWAAVRAMAQIGGPDAAPAVAFMIRELPQAPEVESYNMLIYLSLLGPVAKDAIPAVCKAK